VPERFVGSTAGAVLLRGGLFGGCHNARGGTVADKGRIFSNFFVGAVEMHFPAPINLNIQYLGQQKVCCPFSVNNGFGS